jgi:hypothetical protein
MKYTHYVLDYSGRAVGLASEVDKVDSFRSFCWVYLFGLGDCAEYGYTENSRLVALSEPIESYDRHETEGSWIRVEVF